MSRTHLTPLALLLVSSLAGAQTPASKAPDAKVLVADSVPADSVAPKKSRFGGLLNKAKKVAANKAVQGAAQGVACTIVPGAAAVSAVTGSGPCVNSGIVGGLMSGKLSGTATAMATGATSHAASGLAGKLMGKGGVTGAATKGALGAVGGAGAMSNLAAQAAAMKMMQGAGANGMSNAAAQVAALKMMQSQGMSNAAAAAAMTAMMQNAGAAGMAGGDAAAAMKLMQSMGMPVAGSSAAMGKTAKVAVGAAPASFSKALYDDLAAKGHVVPQGLLFSSGGDRLRTESTPIMQQIATMLEEHPKLKLRIEGHSDNVGVEDANRTLSDKRAATVKAVLIEDYHVNAGRLESKGFGSTKPIAPNDTPEGRSSNWRVELVKM